MKVESLKQATKNRRHLGRVIILVLRLVGRLQKVNSPINNNFMSIIYI